MAISFWEKSRVHQLKNGSVSSVGVSTGSSGVPVTGSPVTSSGTIDLGLGTLAAVDDAPSDGTTYGRLNGTWAATGTGVGIIQLAMFDGNSSTRFDSTTKAVLGGRYFDPSDPAYGLSLSSTATLYVLLETTSGSVAAASELFQKTGTGAPQIIAATATTTSLTADLVTADVTSAFISSAPAGIFVVRHWITTANGENESTCTGAWIEITR